MRKKNNTVEQELKSLLKPQPVPQADVLAALLTQLRAAGLKVEVPSVVDVATPVAADVLPARLDGVDARALCTVESFKPFVLHGRLERITSGGKRMYRVMYGDGKVDNQYLLPAPFEGSTPEFIEIEVRPVSK